ncbi:MAG: flagellar basal body L-ring protein FlgH [Rhodothermaceae bacterium]|nr:flagellar basal body L-ring protein FlgH [Rhodothermaceae bacterium]
MFTNQRFKALVLTASLVLTSLLVHHTALAQQSLFSDIRAFRIGDAITITLAERTAAQRESGWERRTNSGLSGGASLDGGPSLSGSFGVNATFNNQASNQNESVQRDLLQGNMTALVVAIDSLSGNLVVEGERNLNVNGDNHIMTVRGMVRPFDIMSNNSVLSFKLANANIVYRRDSNIKSAIKRPGALAGGAALLLIGAAIVFGSE